MSYQITCSECGDRVRGWDKSQAKESFEAHVLSEHSELAVVQP